MVINKRQLSMKTSYTGRIKFYRGSGMEKDDGKCPSAKKLHVKYCGIYRQLYTFKEVI